MSEYHDKFSGIVGVVAPADAAAVAAARRAGLKIRRLHHHAFFTKDAAATRAFYEDVLGLKMVLVLIDEGDIDPQSPAPKPFLHFFFELGDGSHIAFFEAVPIHYKRPFPELTIFDHHLSLKILDREAMDEIKQKVEAAGFKSMEKDHGFCQSLYVVDPNGLYLEFSYDTEEFDDHFARAEVVSRERFDQWVQTREVDRAKRPAVAPKPAADWNKPFVNKPEAETAG